MVHNNMMYLILKECHYENIDNSYSIVASSKDIDIINNKLRGYQLINDDKKETFSINLFYLIVCSLDYQYNFVCLCIL